jgi:hypothetical protein
MRASGGRRSLRLVAVERSVTALLVPLADAVEGIAALLASSSNSGVKGHAGGVRRKHLHDVRLAGARQVSYRRGRRALRRGRVVAG